VVIDDMLGLFSEFTPKFVKRYRRLGDEIRAAARLRRACRVTPLRR
jgi:3-methyl-2-oxobutanoate hydroxymethyltransferase